MTNTYLLRKIYIYFAVELTIMQSALTSAVIKWYYTHHSYEKTHYEPVSMKLALLS